jgi:hypothetical protein
VVVEPWAGAVVLLVWEALLELGVVFTEVLLAVADSDSVSVTGQTVVVTGMVEVTTVVDSAGQLVTVVAHWVMVTSEVV